MSQRALKHIQIPAASLQRFEDVMSTDAVARMLRQMDELPPDLRTNQVLFNVNSTAQGGGVAEMLHSLLPYIRGAGIDARWLVVRGSPGFFAVTKRLHNRLHGELGDGGALGKVEHETYRRALAAAAREAAHIVRPRDVVVLHDPQTAGLTAAMRELGAYVIWRCHVGLDHPNHVAREAWEFLERYVAGAHAVVFSRDAYVWTGLDGSRVAVIRPSIDPFSAKNQDLGADAVQGILASTGILEGSRDGARYLRHDGSPGRVDHRTEMVEDQRLTPDTRIVLQVSRWDRLKDPAGVMRAFAEQVHPAQPDAHLLLAGPSTARVADDPEGQAVWSESIERRAALAPGVRERVHLASLPMINPEENAAIVNAVQRHADVVVQKSLAEGFGLTVAEAMWKSRPVVAGAIGGISEQIVHNDSGMLVEDPSDLRAFGGAVSWVLADHALGHRLGTAARERVRTEFLHPRHIGDWINVVRRIVTRS